MGQQVSWAAKHTDAQILMLYYHADTAAYSGQLSKTRGLSRQVIATAELARSKDASAGSEGAEALREALFGNGDEARQIAASALTHLSAKDVQFLAGLSLALIGDKKSAINVADEEPISGRHDCSLQRLTQRWRSTAEIRLKRWNC